MTGKTLDPRTDKKMPGWFSWRHQTDTAHVIARENYLALHGPVARRQRAAERLDVSTDYVYDRIKAGELAVVELGHGRAKQRIRADVLQAFIDSRTFPSAT